MSKVNDKFSYPRLVHTKTGIVHSVMRGTRILRCEKRVYSHTFLDDESTFEPTDAHVTCVLCLAQENDA